MGRLSILTRRNPNDGDEADFHSKNDGLQVGDSVDVFDLNSGQQVGTGTIITRYGDDPRFTQNVPSHGMDRNVNFGQGHYRMKISTGGTK